MGYVIANDSSYQRCQLLHHQLKNLNKPNYLVTQLNGEDFPFSPLNNGELLLFDRVLCDVPCSGDAVLRKYPEQWEFWSPLNGIKLHKVQLNILRRGASLLKEGGNLVYSTCSLNPVENEAVISEFLRIANSDSDTSNKFRYIVVDSSANIDKSFAYRPGLLDWDIYLEKDNFEEKKEKPKKVSQNVSDELKREDIENDLINLTYNDLKEKYSRLESLVPSTIFPIQSRESSIEVINKINFQLKNCIRILPHDNDTSGFFISVIAKELNPFYVVPEKEKKIKVNNNYQSPYKNDQLVKVVSFKENPGSNVSEIIDWIANFYGIKSEFDFNCLLTKTDKIRKVYFVNPQLSALFQTKNSKLRTFAAGVRMFEKLSYPLMENSHLSYRICNEGIPYILPYMTKRIIYLNKFAFEKLIGKEEWNMNDLFEISENEKIIDEKTYETLNNMLTGCFLFLKETEDKEIEGVSCSKIGSKVHINIAREDKDLYKSYPDY